MDENVKYAYKGLYNPNEEYTGSPSYKQVVSFKTDLNSERKYFVTLSNNGNFKGVPVTNKSYWEPFEGKEEYIINNELDSMKITLSNLTLDYENQQIKLQDIRNQINEIKNKLKLYTYSESL